MDTTHYLIYAAFIVVLFIYAMPLLQFFILMIYTFRYPEYRLIRKSDLSPDVVSIVKPYEDRLLALGFRHIGTIEHESPIVGNQLTYHMLYYYHDESRVHAFIRTQPHRGAVEPVYYYFETLYDDGSRVTTLNCMEHFVQVVPPSITLFDHYLARIEDAYRAHLEDRRIKALPSKAGAIDREKLSEFLTQEEQEYHASRVKQGYIVSKGRTYKFRFGLPAWRFAKRAVKGYKRHKAILNQPLRSSHDTTSRKQAILTQLQALYQKRGDTNRLLWFAVSMIVFVVLLLVFRFSLTDIVLLLVVLFVHELGHYAAMRYFGYRDTGIFFVPFGAVTVGEKEKRSTFEETVVAFAGPLPGILIGIGIVVWLMMHHRAFDMVNYVFNYALMSLAINYINLLPVYPLDGGRIVTLLLFYRYPKGQFYFYLLSFILLVAASVWMRDPVMLVFVILVGLGLKHSYHTARFLSHLFAHYRRDDIDRDTIADAIVNDPYYGSKPLFVQANLAKQLIYLTHVTRPSKRLIVGALSVYVVLFVLPITVFVAPSILLHFLLV